ncbi:hypothetical protein NKW53_10835 [Acetobacter orientalis]|uniref:hypothetical protein n=1 Tax=Acetobacter orientalis TaxID=146474 RepID=UPI00209E3FBF|nr:hypothetical protein [Acetobacter orientalis]MCP1216558.1 hypothetical protein [Acetobacter orientalis]MCP1219686.1 hypothetical protein [Acetobacter orientalis]
MKLRTEAGNTASGKGSVSSSLISSLSSPNGTQKTNGVSGGTSFRKTLEKLAKQKQALKQETSETNETAQEKTDDTDKTASQTGEVPQTAQGDEPSAQTASAQGQGAQSAQVEDLAQTTQPKSVGVQKTEPDTTAKVKNQENSSSAQDADVADTESAVGVSAASLDAVLATLLGQMEGQQQAQTVSAAATGEPSTTGVAVSGATASADIGGKTAVLAAIGQGASAAMAVGGAKGEGAAKDNTVLAAFSNALAAEDKSTQSPIDTTALTEPGVQTQGAESTVKNAAVQVLKGTAVIPVTVDGARVQFSRAAQEQDSQQSNNATVPVASATAEVSSITLNLQHFEAGQNTPTLGQGGTSQGSTEAALAAGTTALEHAQAHLGQNAGQMGEESEDTPQNGMAQENAQNILAVTAQAVVGQFSSLLEAHTEQVDNAEQQQATNTLQAGSAGAAVKAAITQPSGSNDSLAMTVTMADSTPVTVRFGNSAGVTTSIVLESGNADVLKHLSNNKHDLIQALGAAGLDTSTMKIDVVAPTQSADNNGNQNLENSNQNTAFGGNNAGGMFGGMAEHRGGQNGNGQTWQTGSVFVAHDVKETDTTESGTQRSRSNRDGRVVNITA